jgi:site-specific DNA recombinase
MRKVALYIRVSTEEQAKVHEGSLVSQRQRLEDYVKARNTVSPGWGAITGTFIDEARSGKNINRPEFQRLLREIELKKVDTVLVTELSRLSRSIKDFCYCWDFLKANQAQFLSLREQFDTTTAAGEMMMFSIMNFAQFERKQTSERVSANFQARAERGLFNGGYPTLGYDRDPEKRGYLFVNEDEAAQARAIFQTFLEVGNMADTLRSINAQGMRTKRHIRKDGQAVGGEEWTPTTLWRFLTNRNLIGEREINKKSREFNKKTSESKNYSISKAAWAAIVDPKVFNAVQKILSSNQSKYKPGKQKNFDYLLSSKVFCSDCAGSLVGMSGVSKTKRKYHYYGHKDKSPKCLVTRVDAEKLHEVIRKRLKRLVSSSKMTENLFSELQVNQKEWLPEIKLRHEGIKSQLKTLATQSKSLLDKLEQMDTGEASRLLMERIKEHEKRILELSDEDRRIANELDSKNSRLIDSESFKWLLSNWNSSFAKLSVAERRQFYRSLIGSIEVFPKQLKIKYNCDMRSFENAAMPLGVAATASSAVKGKNFENFKLGSPIRGSDRSFGTQGSYIVSSGGERGIRTPDTLSSTPVFKTGAFNHSAISPW